MFYRREYSRFILNDSASLTTKEGREITLIVKDLCVRGAGVISDSALEVGQKEKVVISAPCFFLQPLAKEVKVAWCRRIDKNLWQAGLDFGLVNKINFPNACPSLTATLSVN